jgi:hypothetical protein
MERRELEIAIAQLEELIEDPNSDEPLSRPSSRPTALRLKAWVSKRRSLTHGSPQQMIGS